MKICLSYIHTAIIMLAFLLVEVTTSSTDSHFLSGSEDTNSYYFDYIEGCSTIETGCIGERDYLSGQNDFIFIKNISAGNDYSAKEQNIIVVEKETLHLEGEDIVYIYMHPDYINKKDVKEKFIQDRKIRPEFYRGIFVAPHNLWEREKLINRISLAREYSENPDVLKEIKEPIDYIVRIISLKICEGYISALLSDASSLSRDVKAYNDTARLVGIKKKDIEKLVLLSGNACSLINKVFGYNDKRNAIKACETYEFYKKKIKRIFKNNISIRKNSIEETFNHEAKIIIERIESRMKECAEYPLNDLKKMFKEDIIMFINILSNGALSLCMHESTEETQKPTGRIQKWLDKEIAGESKKSDFSLLSEEKLKKNAELWNRDLLALLFKKLLKEDELIEEEKDCRRRIHAEYSEIIEEIVERRQNIYNGYVEINMTKEILLEEIKKVVEILRNWSRNEKDLSKSEKKKIVSEESKKIIEILAGISVDRSSMKELSEESAIEEKEYNKKQLLDMLDHIEKKVPTLNVDKPGAIRKRMSKLFSSSTKLFPLEESISSSNLDILSDFIEKEKYKMLLSIFKGLFTSSYRGAVNSKMHLMTIVDSILSAVISERIDNTSPKMIADAKKEIKKERESIMQKEKKEILEKALSIYDKYCYTSYRDPAFFPESFDFSNYVFRSIKVAIDENAADLCVDLLMERYDLKELLGIYKPLRDVYSYTKYLAAYNEIWENPAFVIFNRGTEAAPNEKNTAYIIYNSEKDRSLYKKEISFTNENVEAFKKANTTEEIEKIPGEVQKLKST